MTPSLPPARPVAVPGLGELTVRELPGPPGAPTLVLLHGWTVTADLNWFRCYETLGRHYRVLAFDHRGHGRGLRSARRFRLADCAADVVAVADALGIGSFVPVGYSMGGCVAQLLARDHPERVEGLVLCATSSNFRGTGMERARFALLPAVSELARAMPGPARERIYRRVLESRLAGDGLSEWAKDEIRSCDPRLLLDAGSALFRFDSTRWLPDLTHPTAVVVTTRDGRVPAVRQLALATAIPGASVHEVEGTHVVCVSAPDRFLPPLLDAVASVVSRRAGTTLGGSHRSMAVDPAGLVPPAGASPAGCAPTPRARP